ncbi:hypothetical protein [Coleofasciculus sp. H7-2]|uniref:hypothetical protein n=1 Tax=Coleofasciculus sp. H7-2 TaxID=3351545 RepID=UPI0036702906
MNQEQPFSWKLQQSGRHLQNMAFTLSKIIGLNRRLLAAYQPELGGTHWRVTLSLLSSIEETPDSLLGNKSKTRILIQNAFILGDRFLGTHLVTKGYNPKFHLHLELPVLKYFTR